MLRNPPATRNVELARGMFRIVLRQELFGPVADFVTKPNEREEVRRDQEIIGEVELFAVGRPSQRGADVVPIAIEDGIAVELARTHLQRTGGLRRAEIVREMSITELCDLTSAVEAFLAVLAKWLQHPVPHLAIRTVCDDHRLVDQGADQIDDLVDVHEFVRAHRFGGFEIEPSREHRSAIEQRLLGFAQQLIRPSHRGTQRLMSLGYAPAAEHAEPVVEPVG